MENQIHIPNLSLGNTSSVVNMINKVGGQVQIANTPEELMSAKKIILPGVGSFDTGIKEIRVNGWEEVLNKLVIENGVPILGICLGMQMFFEESEEGIEKGLGWVSGKLVKFKNSTTKDLKIPHMGWNAINLKNKSELINKKADEELRYYFVHSYHAICNSPIDIVASVNYGSEVTAAIQKSNIYGVQFHPEKSHRFGMDIFRNFIAI